VVKRPRGGHRFFKAQNFGLVIKTWLNWRPDWALSWKGETTGWEGRGVGMWQAGTSKDVAPAYVGYGPMGWPQRVSLECTNRMLVI
jgi:hypothetical protein